MAQIIKDKDWKFWGLIGCCGLAAVTTVAYVSQAKNASIGRQVKRNVLQWLQTTGTTVDKGVVSGGVVSMPMTEMAAVIATINAMLAERSSGGSGAKEDVATKQPTSTEPTVIGDFDSTQGEAKKSPTMPTPSYDPDDVVPKAKNPLVKLIQIFLSNSNLFLQSWQGEVKWWRNEQVHHICIAKFKCLTQAARACVLLCQRERRRREQLDNLCVTIETCHAKCTIVKGSRVVLAE